MKKVIDCDKRTLNEFQQKFASFYAMQKYILRAEVGKALTNHSGRHTFATLFIQKTSDVATLQRLLGHTRIEDTMVYVHITDFNLKNQMNNFDKGLDFLDENNKILE